MQKGYGLLLVLLTLFSQSLHAQRDPRVMQKPPENTRLLFLLDGSGSMFADWGGNIRMNVAKNLLIDLVDSLRVDQNLDLALRAYGHQYESRYKNCEDTRLEVGFGPDNYDEIIFKLRQIQPKGTTPIAYSLQQAASDFPRANNKNTRNVIIIITDGIESCDGDPCAVSKALQRKNIFLKPFVIGIGMSKDYEEEFDCVGQFFDARDVNDFRNVLNKVLTQTLEETTVSVELLDINKQPTETNVNVTFINNSTQLPMYNFVHYRDRQGDPDSVTVDAVLSYDVVVNTIPPVVKRNIAFEGGTHNVVRIQSPQGTLNLQQPGYTEYDKGVKALVRKNGEVVNVHNMAEDEKYLVGTYNLEILTLPKTYVNNVRIRQSETTNISLPGPGIVNLYLSADGIGSIYELNPDGSQTWVVDLPRNKSQHSQALQPGKYKVVFRARDAMGSKYTKIKDFTITSGKMQRVNVLEN